MGGTKKNAVDKVIDALKAERDGIDASIRRLEQAQQSVTKTRKPRAQKASAGPMEGTH